MEGDLKRRIGKREPFETREEEALLNLARTADRVQARVGRLLREHGLTPAQYNVLRILRGLGRPTPILEVAESMLAETPGITGLIDRLERLELVRRVRCESDRRVIFVVLGPRGSEMLADLDGPMAELRSSLFAGLSPANLLTLNRLLDRVREPLETPRDGGSSSN